MNEFLERAMGDLGTPEDATRGFRDILIRTSDGVEHTLRLTPVHPNFTARVLKRYAATEDPRDLVRAMLAPQFSRDDFLNSILAQDLVRLCNAAAALMIGPEKLKAMICGGLKAKGIS